MRYIWHAGIGLAAAVFTLSASAFSSGQFVVRPPPVDPSMLLTTNVSNPNFPIDQTGKALILTGSHTWNTFQDTSQSTSPAAFDFTQYVNMLTYFRHNTTILWRKDLPTYCSWGAGGTWHTTMWPWVRNGGSNGDDGLPKFSLAQLNQAYFDRLRSRTIQLGQNRIYAIVELFDGLGTTDNRCANADGYPFTSANNLDGISDGGGSASYTMTSANAISNVQDNYVKKVIDTVGDLANVIFEISEEAPNGSQTWWQGHMIDLIHTYESVRPMKHLVLYPTINVNFGVDTDLYNSNAEVVAPLARTSPTTSCGSGTPTCKVNINDSDHSYFGMWNDTAQQNRNYVWENVARGNGVIWMDPYVINWTTGSRNLCVSPTNGVCTDRDTRWDNLRSNLGQAAVYGNRMKVVNMSPQNALSDTTYCLANAGVEYLVYAPTGGTFHVDLSAGSGKTFAVEWYNPVALTISFGTDVSGGGSSTAFTTPGGFTADSVLYLKAR